MPERTDIISLQDLDVVASSPSRQNTYRLDSKSERNFDTLEQFETSIVDKNVDSDIEPQNTSSNSNNEDFEEDSDQEKFKTYLTSNCTSSDIESDVDRDELKPESPSEDRRFSQHLPASYINPYTSTFGAEETRLRFSLESVQFEDRLGSLVAPHCREEALRQGQPLVDSKQSVISQSAVSSSQHSSPNPKSLQCSPQPVFPSQGQRSRSSLSFSNDDDSNAAVFPRIKEGLYFCHLCSFSGTTQQEFDVHMTVHFEHTCPHCDYKSRTEGRLKRHIKDFHTEDTDGGYGARAMPGRPKVFRCKQCEYFTTDKLEFWTHTRSHIKEDKLLQCPRCPFVTEYKHHLEYHLRNHFGSKPFKCPKCNYACVNKSMLNSHMKSHTNVYQYRCADCVYATKYCHSLKLHLRNYNHKPAAVLNSDGSLPKGIDATASGLSLLAKRGPPRGPRGTKKSKLDPGTSSFLPMPPSPIRPLPEFQGMIPSFWPMLPSQFPGRFPATLSMGHRFNSSVAGMPFMTPIKSEETRSPTRRNPNSYKCNFCNFVSTNRDVLTGHVMLIHAHETRGLFSMYGLPSEPQLEDGQIRINPLNMYRSPMKFSRTEILSGNSECFLDIKKEVTEEIPNIKGSNEKDGPVKETMKSSPYQFLNEKFQADSHVADKGMDILKEMTLKFGSGQADVKYKLSSNSSSNDFAAADGPLDLTKPRLSTSLCSNQAASAVPDFKKDGDSCGENSVDSNEVISPPTRKRSRKGKAFRLDTLCMKMQEVQKDIYHSEDSNVDLHEMNTSDLLTIKGDECTEDQAKFEESISVEENGSDDIKSPKWITSDENQTKKEIMDDKNERHDSSNEIEKVNDEKVHNLLASPVLSNEMKDVNRTDLTHSEESKNLENDVLNLTSNSETSPQEFTSPSCRKAIPAVLEHGAGIAWKILNNSRIKNPSDILNNCGNGHSWELSPLDKELWMESPNYINTLQKVEKTDFRCPYCQISFGDCIMYSIHMGYHGYKDPYKCNMCGFTGKDRVEFFLHIARDAHN